MGFLDRLKPRTPEQRYMDFISKVKNLLANWEPSRPLDNTLWNNDLLKEVKKISKKSPDYYKRSRFIAGFFGGLQTLQNQSFKFYITDMARIKGTISHGLNNIKSEKDAFNYVLSTRDSNFYGEFIKAISIAATLVKLDPEVDIKVAKDLGKGDSYPERPKLSTNDFQKNEYSIFWKRIRLFWNQVTSFPVPKVLAILEKSTSEADEINELYHAAKNKLDEAFYKSIH